MFFEGNDAETHWVGSFARMAAKQLTYAQHCGELGVYYSACTALNKLATEQVIEAHTGPHGCHSGQSG